MFVLCSCTSPNSKVFPFYQYLLGVSFQDASGNDLVKGIEYELEDGLVPNPTVTNQGIVISNYTFEIIYPDLCMDVYYQHYHNSGAVIPADIGQHPDIWVKKFDNRYFLWFDVFTCSRTRDTDHCPMANTLTFKLSCPDLFSDDEVHELVTYWKQDKEISIRTGGIYCSHIEFDGKEYNTQTIYETYDIKGFEHIENPISAVTVLLDGK